MRRHGQQLGLERRRELVVALPEIAERAVEDIDGSAEVAAGRQRAAELERDLGSWNDAGRRRHGLAQMPLERIALAVRRLGYAELVQDGTAILPVGRLLERAAKVVSGRLGGTADRCVTSGGSQHGNPCLVSGGRKAQQVPGDLLALGAAGCEQLRGCGVQRLALERRDLLVHGAAHERVHEVERAVGRQHVDAHQRVCARRRHRLVHAGEGRCLVERGTRTENRHRARDCDRLARQLPQPPPDRAADALGPEVEHASCVLRGAVNVPCRELVEQLAEQERVPSCRTVARRAEARDRLG